LECPPADDFPWTMEITVNNVTDSWMLDCATTPKSASALAAAWAAQINGDGLGRVVTATASGNVITLTSIAKGG
jgi:phage tail sheath gpL-like